MAAFNLSDRDIDALSRIAYAEARNIASKTGDLKEAYGSVVDAILNRAAADESYLGGSRVRDVIDHTNHPKYYQFTPIAGTRNKSWSGLPKAPESVRNAVKSHLADLQKGKDNTIGKNTHYLNPNVTGTAAARNSWASDWESWPQVGIAPVEHRFGNPDDLDVPDYSVSYEPPPGFPAPPMPDDMSPAAQYGYYGLTRSLAPAMPVDRTIPTTAYGYQRAADLMGAAGIRGLDGRGQPLSAPVSPVERAPLGPISTPAPSLPGAPLGVVERGGPLADPTRTDAIGTPWSPSPQRPDNSSYAGPKGLGGPGGLYLGGLPPQQAPVTVPTTQRGLSIGLPASVPATPVQTQAVPLNQIGAFPPAPMSPQRQTARSVLGGALKGAVTGGLPGAVIGGLLGPARAQIGRNISHNRNYPGNRVSPFDNMFAGYRGLFGGRTGGLGGGLFGGLLSTPNYSATPFSVGSGMNAISSVFGAPAGAMATARSNPEVSFTSLGNGMVSRTNSETGVTTTMSPGDY